MMAETPAPHLLWLEGVNFVETLADTTTLSVIRGASLALLDAPAPALVFLQARNATYELIFGGASIALFRATTTAAGIERDAEALLLHLHGLGETPDDTGATPPFAHLRFVAGTAPDDGAATGPALAQGAARRAQLAGWLPRRKSEAGTLRQCLFSQQRVAETTLTLREDHAARYGAQDGKVLVSKSALARWHYGREERQRFYHRHQGLSARLGTLIVTDNLQDMVALEPHQKDPKQDRYDRYVNGLPLALLGKLALVYADGNDFTAIRREMGGTPEALGVFSERVKTVVMEGLAAAFGAVADHANGSHCRAAVFHDAGEEKEKRLEQLRFETLLYGGDEIAFVAPAWFGLAMAAAFFEAVKGATLQWNGGEWPLTFSMGIALAPVKMPIRASYELAEALSKSAKPAAKDEGADIPAAERRCNRLAIHAFESVEPPGNGLTALRRGLFGDTRQERRDDAGRLWTAQHPLLALDGDGFEEAMAAFATLKKDRAVPRSQLFRMLRAAQWPQRGPTGFGAHRALGDPQANEKAAEVFKDYLDGPGRGATLTGWAERLKDPAQAAMAAWLMTHLWDYVAPLEGLRA
jgi:hypothetical protein